MPACAVLPLNCCGHSLFAHGARRCHDCHTDGRTCPTYGGEMQAPRRTTSHAHGPQAAGIVESITAAEYRALAAKTMSERQFQAQVVRAAKARGWMVYHTWRSDHSEAGFPDLELLREGQCIVAELKREGKHPTPAQDRWLTAWGRIAGVLVFCWHPSDLDTILEILE